ncbi:MAG: UDP-2,4-diacetamido-2,4,6-trideoxy-beta-L-altropyranose hydrolase [Burkholderiaceae bacterium]
MNAAVNTVALRVDASNEIGTGHFMRCLTLANALQEFGVRTRFVSRHMPQYLQSLLSEKGHEFSLIGNNSSQVPDTDLRHAHWLGTTQLIDSQETRQALSDQDWDWLVVDHYALDERWESVLRSTAKRILVIDDLADRAHNCDVLLDQNFYINMDTRYSVRVSHDCKLLLGPRYALLREEFRNLHDQASCRSGLVKRVLVFFGGVDADNCTSEVIDALAQFSNLDLIVDVVIGSQHPFRKEIEAKCIQHGFFIHVQTTMMADLMAKADLAIGAGGASTWERCCVGLPALVFAIAENQQQLVNDAGSRGLIYGPEMRAGLVTTIETHLTALLDNPSLLRSISRAGLETVDGRGVQRILRAIGCSRVEMRKATKADSQNLFNWRNHISIRSVSRRADLINQSDHEKWFDAVQSDPQRHLLIGIFKNETIGVVRFDVHSNEAEISIYIIPGRQADGLGSELLIAAENWLTEYRPDIVLLKAEVLGGNQASQNLFRINGYQSSSSLHIKKVTHL